MTSCSRKLHIAWVVLVACAAWLSRVAPAAAQGARLTGSSDPFAIVEGTAVVTDGPAKETYGTSSNTWLTLSAWNAQPIDSSFTYSFANVGGGEWIARSNSSGSQWVHLPFHLPNGALLTQVEITYCDTGATAFHAFLFQQPKNGSIGVTDLLASSGTPGCVVQTATLGSPLTIDNTNNNYFLEFNMGDLTDQSILFQVARIGYKLQVSPAPSVATFADVPTSSPQFRFVEALHAAGITAGCGGGNFCPNDPLTRGQMAVFLSVALGLHWPN